MGAASGYIFAAMWLIIGVYLVFQASKTTKWFYLISVFFFYLAAWYLINELIETNLFSSPYVWIFRGICLVFLVIAVILVVTKRKDIIKKFDEKDENEE